MSKPPRDMLLEERELRLKIATRKTVKAAGGTGLAAEITAVRQQRISDCQCNNVPEYLRINEALHLEEEVAHTPEWPAITRTMARHHGFALLPLPDSSMIAGTSDFHKAIADVSRETGEAVARTCAALADGEVTPDEVKQGELVEEIDQAINSLVMLRGLCVAAATQPKLRSVAEAHR
jgi:hypothetical protein